ncbi:4-amino-4-deoxychorismate lyase [Paramesorhizobium deserti]|uniref:Endolytic murein transglycosylase n=2 Tax=Paramesorhizobium deserti TaxID=1494590 RepID=A0A135HY67_9HYPH|nr:endolytic transglycosylase MltG [Paramesorhizobium deserti]KXF78098.1 4-amino-4-deoxychorismate lyase [Paramesorhizobium deserti]
MQNQASAEPTEAAPVQKPIVPKSASEALRPEPGTPPPPPRRRSRHARSQIVVFANFLLSLLVLAVVGASVLFYFGKLQFDAAGPSPAASTFLVKRGSGIVEIADGLERRGLISDARIFRYGVRAYGHEKDMKAGEYEVAAHASMRDIMETLRSGKSIMHSLTIPEGLTVQQIFDRIAANEVLAGDMPDTLPPEGSMFADTLRFTRGTMRQEIVTKLQAEQKKLVDEVWAKRNPDLPLKNVNEFVTLASIVEKETGVASERPHVASVFVNRLRKGMRLQSDPTIIYGLFGGKGKPADRPIYRSDIDKPTPYNTYIINGLPPTPVANPGRAALEAVANPLQTDDLYFVADGTGGHVFAATLKEHNDNVRRWRSIEQQKKEEAAKAAVQGGTDGEAEPGQGQPGQ